MNLTPLQTRLVAAFDVLDDARANLSAVEYEALLDIIAARLARDYIARLRIGDGKEAAA